MNKKDLQNHLSLYTSKDIAEFCKPLFEYFPISDFTYTQLYSNGSRSLLTSNPKFLYENYSQNQGVFNSKFRHNKFMVGDFMPGYSHAFHSEFSYPLNLHYFLDRWKQYFRFRQEVEEICDVFYVSYINNEVAEIFSYDIKSKNNYMRIILDNLDLLKLFQTTFVNRMYQVISILPTNLIALPWRTCKSYGINRNFQFDKMTKEAFIKRINFNRLYVDKNNYLTKSEISCLKIYLQGGSAKEIADKLNLSQRTIETYIDNIKTKLKMRSRYQIVSHFINSNIFYKL